MKGSSWPWSTNSVQEVEEEEQEEDNSDDKIRGFVSQARRKQVHSDNDASKMDFFGHFETFWDNSEDI